MKNLLKISVQYFEAEYIHESFKIYHSNIGWDLSQIWLSHPIPFKISQFRKIIPITEWKCLSALENLHNFKLNSIAIEKMKFAVAIA